MAASKRNDVLAALRTAEEEAALPHGKGDGTAMRICRETGIGEQNVRNHLQALEASGEAHIFCWTDGHSTAPVWVSGPGKSAPKPAPLPIEELRKRGAERRRSRAEVVREPGWAKRTTYAFIERVRQTPQSWCSPLMEAV